MNELKHHGILGQRWGVRRFQNEDGTLTEAGKERYNNSLGGRLENAKDKEEKHRIIRVESASIYKERVDKRRENLLSYGVGFAGFVGAGALGAAGILSGPVGQAALGTSMGIMLSSVGKAAFDELKILDRVADMNLQAAKHDVADALVKMQK